MVRLQVQLELAQHRQVKRQARRLGVSVSEVIRRCVDSQLRAQADDDPGERVRRALAVAGKYVDPRGDPNVASPHDTALADAYRR